MNELVAKNAIVVPHGSFVEYVGEKVDNLAVPIYGNRASLAWERSREKMFEWMHKAGVKTPRILKPEEIDGPALVKFQGPKAEKDILLLIRKRNSRRECAKLETPNI